MMTAAERRSPADALRRRDLADAAAGWGNYLSSDGSDPRLVYVPNQNRVERHALVLRQLAGRRRMRALPGLR